MIWRQKCVSRGSQREQVGQIERFNSAFAVLTEVHDSIYVVAVLGSKDDSYGLYCRILQVRESFWDTWFQANIQ